VQAENKKGVGIPTPGDCLFVVACGFVIAVTFFLFLFTHRIAAIFTLFFIAIRHVFSLRFFVVCLCPDIAIIYHAVAVDNMHVFFCRERPAV